MAPSLRCRRVRVATRAPGRSQLRPTAMTEAAGESSESMPTKQESSQPSKASPL